MFIVLAMIVVQVNTVDFSLEERKVIVVIKVGVDIAGVVADSGIRNILHNEFLIAFDLGVFKGDFNADVFCVIRDPSESV